MMTRDTTTHGVDGYGGDGWCGEAWSEILRASNDRELVTCELCKIVARQSASSETVEAEIRRACADFPNLGHVVFGHAMRNGQVYPTVEGMTYNSNAGSFEQLRHKAQVIASQLALRVRPPPCGVCRGVFTLLCHACKGGVGT